MFTGIFSSAASIAIEASKGTDQTLFLSHVCQDNHQVSAYVLSSNPTQARFLCPRLLNSAPALFDSSDHRPFDPAPLTTFRIGEQSMINSPITLPPSSAPTSPAASHNEDLPEEGQSSLPLNLADTLVLDKVAISLLTSGVDNEPALVRIQCDALLDSLPYYVNGSSIDYTFQPYHGLNPVLRGYFFQHRLFERRTIRAKTRHECLFGFCFFNLLVTLRDRHEITCPRTLGKRDIIEMYTQLYFQHSYAQVNRTRDAIFLLQLAEENHCTASVLQILTSTHIPVEPPTASLHFDPVSPTLSDAGEPSLAEEDFEPDDASTRS